MVFVWWTVLWMQLGGPTTVLESSAEERAFVHEITLATETRVPAIAEDLVLVRFFDRLGVFADETFRDITFRITRGGNEVALFELAGRTMLAVDCKCVVGEGIGVELLRLLKLFGMDELSTFFAGVERSYPELFLAGNQVTGQFLGVRVSDEQVRLLLVLPRGQGDHYAATAYLPSK